MSPRTWAARVQSAFAERASRKPPSGLDLARQAIIVLVGLAGTGVLAYFLFFAPIPVPRTPAAGALPAPAPIVVAGPQQATAGASAAPAASAAPGSSGPTDAHAPATAQVPPTVALLAPVPGRVLVPFGWAYSRTMEDWRLHGGLSFAAGAGEPVRAAAQGTVASVAQDPLWGLMVVVDDGSGVGTEYASLSSAAVRQGETVQPGEVIGTAGATAAAEADLGPHLYFALVENGQAVDPAPLIKRPSD